jgi:hypothetical protein
MYQVLFRNTFTILSTAFKAASTGPVPIAEEIYSIPSSVLSLIVAVGNPKVPHTT